MFDSSAKNQKVPDSCYYARKTNNRPAHFAVLIFQVITHQSHRKIMKIAINKIACFCICVLSIIVIGFPALTTPLLKYFLFALVVLMAVSTVLRIKKANILTQDIFEINESTKIRGLFPWYETLSGIVAFLAVVLPTL